MKQNMKVRFEFIGRGKKLRQLASEVADLKVQNQTLQLITAGAIGVSLISTGLGVRNSSKINRTRRDFEATINDVSERFSANENDIADINRQLQAFGLGMAQGQQQNQNPSGQQQNQNPSGQQQNQNPSGQQHP